ncbi:MAG TPA: PE-PPE domain-containing protein [Mycobacterium sp.]|nr:PE-PPE domain-containing protein [Mycobacterium sp.]
MLIVPGTNYKRQPSERTTGIGSGFYPGADIVIVHYPASARPYTGINSLTAKESVRIGAANLDAAIRAADRPLVVVGQSQGAVVIDAAQAKLASDPTAPTADELQFVLFSDPHRGLMSLLPKGTYIPVFDWTTTTPVDSQYDTTIVIGEYDGWADPLDRPWNLLAAANALMGAGATRWFRTRAGRASREPAIHGRTRWANPADIPQENIKVTTNSRGAKVTTMRVPTKTLPLTDPLRRVVADRVVDRIDKVLRPRIDAGYSRTDKSGDRRIFVAGGRLKRRNAGDDVLQPS